MSRSQRLKIARAGAGYTTAAEAARVLRVPYGTYAGHENGQRSFGEDDLERYAQAFNVQVAWLAFGTEHQQTSVEIMGLIRDDGLCLMGGSLSDGTIDVPFVVPENVHAYSVETQQSGGRYDFGDVILCAYASPEKIEDFIGEEILVRTVDGFRFGWLRREKSRLRVSVSSGKSFFVDIGPYQIFEEVVAILRAGMIERSKIAAGEEAAERTEARSASSTKKPTLR